MDIELNKRIRNAVFDRKIAEVMELYSSDKCRNEIAKGKNLFVKYFVAKCQLAREGKQKQLEAIVEDIIKHPEAFKFFFDNPSVKNISVEKTPDNVRNVLARDIKNAQAMHDRIIHKRLELYSECYKDIITKSKKMLEVFEIIDKVKDKSLTILIQGETGTGKELVARAIHECGLRRDNPFITVDCGAKSEQLLESELFGHKKGAFTGANTDMHGLFKAADTGTIFLDEIGNLSIPAQRKFLRVLQGKEFTPVRSTVSIKVDVRIIAATNKNLEQEVSKETFLDDLFPRLNKIRIHLPPLRERPEDIPKLVEHFTQKVVTKEKLSSSKHFDKEAIKTMQQDYDWPKNVRELENFVERRLVLCHSEIIRKDNLELSAKRCEGDSTLNELKKDLILQTLVNYGWNRTKAAKHLRISRTTLATKIRQYHLSKKEN